MTAYEARSIGSGPQEHEFLKKVVMDDAKTEREQLQDHLKDHGIELIKMNLVEEGKSLQRNFISDSFSLEYKKVILNLLKGYKDILRGLCLICVDSIYGYSHINTISEKELDRSSRLRRTLG